LAGVAGWIWYLGLQPVAIVLLAGAMALVVAAYVAASRRDVDGTTEVAALVVLSAGFLAGTGYLVLASALVAITTLLLIEKSRIGLKRRDEKVSVQPLSNPLQLMSALQMAVMFQVVLFVVHAVRSHWGETGLLWSGAVLGLTDVDVLTISMAKSAEGQIPIPVAAEAIAIGILSNTILKLLLGAVIGKGRFRKLTPAWLGIMAIASAASIVALH
jgi:uncharacterized membrane protein (DUF4010 family)